MELVFDHGTLLLRDAPRERPRGLGEGWCWDPRVSAWRAPAHGYGAAVDGGTGPWSRDTVPRWRAVDRGWCRDPEEIPGRLRPYQAAAVWAWARAGARGVVVLPTGSGKTWVARGAVARLRTPTLVMVPTRVLLHQWRRTLQPLVRGAVGVWGDGQRRLAPVTVCTFESAWRHMPRWGDAFGLLIVDEVHHFGGAGAARRAALEMSAAPHRLGLTATPPEPAAPWTDAASDPVASDVPGLTQLVGPVVYRATVGELVGEYLAPFHRVTLLLSLTPRERREYEREVGAFRTVYQPFRLQAPGAPFSAFLAEASRSDAGRRAVAAWRRSRRILAFTEAKAEALTGLLSRHREQQCLVFTANNATAYRVAREHLIMPVTCDIGRREREWALARFQRSELRALVSTRVLNEGLDVQGAEVGILVGGTAGTREYVQRLGRVLRPAAGKHALIYELVTRASPEVRRVREREQSLGPLVDAATIRHA